MDNPWVVLAAIAGVGSVYVLLPVITEAFLRFRQKRDLICPEAGMNAEVSVDARRAAFGAAIGRPALRVKTCSLWPERSGCARSCLDRFEEAKLEPLRSRVS